MPGGPPLFQAESETVWNTNSTPKTASVTVKAGDILAVCLAASDIGAPNISFTPSGGSLTYNLQQSISQSSACPCYLWTATCTSDTTFSVSVARGGDATPHWGCNVLQFRGATGVGASAKAAVTTNVAPSLTFTTSADSSALVVVNADWAAVDGTTRTWRTPSGASAAVEQTYQLDTGQYASYVAYHADAGPAGSKTVGLSQPGGQTPSLMAVEILGWAKPPQLVANLAAVNRAGRW